ncbi:MAG: 3-deoxy-7-phosphoheptulonate synthase [bacterium]|nr:3-deoxy-7-phosphoheptulonate synthase [bacterium]
MIVVMQAGASADELAEVVRRIEELGFRAHVMHGVERQVIGCLGDEREKSGLHVLETIAGVSSVMPILSPYKLAARQLQAEPSVVAFGDNCRLGAGVVQVIAGPCSVENEEQIVETAKAVRAAGATALRGGAFKPRSSAYAFQGLGVEGLRLLRLAGDETGLPIVTELLDVHDLDVVLRYADVIQVGARNMQNFSLLKEIGKTRHPVVLKRGMAATIDEWLSSAEYILAGGNSEVVLCERGIRTFETATRNTLDLNAVPVVRDRTHLPIVVDPSHGTGVRRYVKPMALAAVAAGADGLMIEVHNNPDVALSDGAQSLRPEEFRELMQSLRPVVAAVGKEIAGERCE